MPEEALLPAPGVPLDLAPRPGRRPVPFPGGRLRGYNPVDIVFMTYVGIICILLVLGRSHLPSWHVYLAVHLVIFAGVACLRLVPHLGNFPLQFVRESYPLWLMPVAYSELDVLNRLRTTRYYDDLVLRWDQWLFGGHPHLYLHTWMPNIVVSEFLHFCYLFYVLLVPILGLTLYFQSRKEAFRVFATSVALTMYSCYVIFMLFPVEGPWYTFARPAIPRGFFGSIVGSYLRGASVGCAFPSSHVAGAISVAVMAHWFSRRLFYALLVLAAGIAVGTVYGGFHYGVDALAGLAFGLGMALLGPQVHRALLRRHRLPHIHWRFPHLSHRFRRGGMRRAV